MELNEILNGFAGGEGRPVNNGCGEVVGGCRDGIFGNSFIWLILLFWLCCGGCGFGGFGGFGGGFGGGCCCDDRRRNKDFGGYGYGCGNNGCTWIIWIIILCVLCSGRGFGCFGRREVGS